MKIEQIHIKQTESTNNYARRMCLEQKNTANFCVVAHHQTSGKGQLAAVWETEAGKNLTFSLVFQNLKFDVNEQFKLSALVSLNLLTALKKMGFYKVELKWPNDVISERKKIAGVLIETIIKNKFVNTAIIGIGLNVNQIAFSKLPNASSLKSISGVHYALEEVLHFILIEMEKIPIQLKTRTITEVIQQYQKSLFRKNQASMFQFQNGTMQPGIIKGVTKSGLLNVLFEDEKESTFDLKEIKLIY